MTKRRASNDGRRYARVHHDLRTKLPAAVYHDADLLAAWLKLYLAADSAWPDVAELPRAVDAERLPELERAGVLAIDPEDPFYYRMRGLDDERRAASQEGRDNYAKRKDREPPPPSAPDAAIKEFYARRGRYLHRDLHREVCTTDRQTDRLTRARVAESADVDPTGAAAPAEPTANGQEAPPGAATDPGTNGQRYGVSAGPEGPRLALTGDDTAEPDR